MRLLVMLALMCLVSLCMWMTVVDWRYESWAHRVVNVAFTGILVTLLLALAYNLSTDVPTPENNGRDDTAAAKLKGEG